MNAEQIRELPVGTHILAVEDSGERTVCVIGYRGHPSNKFLTYRVRGQVRWAAIESRPGVHYERV